jgi:transposase
MLDEVIITQTPPLYSCYCRIGKQASVPITGDRQKRILHGVINIRSGDVLLLITEVWDEVTHQYFLQMIRQHWCGWQIVLFEDRGTPHTAEESRELAIELGIEVRLLPRATPELNAMDHLWRHVKGRALANRSTITIDRSAEDACRYIFDLTPQQRLQQAGVLSGNFWLTK